VRNLHHARARRRMRSPRHVFHRRGKGEARPVHALLFACEVARVGVGPLKCKTPNAKVAKVSQRTPRIKKKFSFASFAYPSRSLRSVFLNWSPEMMKLPARYDHVGSFLRPKYLLEAREKKARGEIDARQLREVEDKAIAEIVKFQESIGLKSVTDGEFRRTYFHLDFLEQLGGVKTDIPVTVKKPDGTEELAPPVIRVVDKVRHAKDIQKADFEYLKSQLGAGHTPKVTIPSPTMLHFRGGRAGISKQAYPELDPVFYDDVAKAYGDELRSLYE